MKAEIIKLRNGERIYIFETKEHKIRVMTTFDDYIKDFQLYEDAQEYIKTTYKI
jgi:hypothetical protein